MLARTDARRFNFTGVGGGENAGWTLDLGEAFDESRGYGWTRNLQSEFRRRGRLSEEFRDSFRFTRAHDTWELTLPSGAYRVLLSVGDSDHEQPGQNVTIEGSAVFRDVDTPAGVFREGEAVVAVGDGRLTVEIGRPGSTTNTCLNWVIVVPAAE